MNSVIALLIDSLIGFLNIYIFLLFARIILSWFPNIEWYKQPFQILNQLTEPYLRLFRSIIPPLGGLDLSPILGFLLIQVLVSALSSLEMTALAMGL